MTDHRAPYVTCLHCPGEVISDGLGSWIHSRGGQYVCEGGTTAAEPAPAGTRVPARSDGRGYYKDRLTQPWNAAQANERADELSAKLRSTGAFARGVSGPA